MQVTILGSTGSIGQNTLSVIKQNHDKYNVYALTANESVDLLFNQCQEYQPRFAVLRNVKAAKELKVRLAGHSTEVLSGPEGLVQVASDSETDIVMAAIVGGAGLESALSAAKAGKRLLLANKESLVMAGALFMKAAADNNATLLPIDSEHNAIFQCLANGAKGHAKGVRKLILTSSGGPLRTTPMDELAGITPDQACAHPNFKMGRKISVDSATMMNKGLELIEARWLFDTKPSQIEIIIHPQQIIHSMVDYVDGSMVAQLGYPDMRTPIAHGLSWPDRIESGVASLDLLKMGPLDFETPDTARYPAIVLARNAAEGADSMPIALNAANEIAVDAFLHELIGFIDIPLIVESVLAKTSSIAVSTLDDIIQIDQESRDRAREAIKGLDRS